MNNKLTAKERRHLARIKMLPCSCCDAPGPSQAHHIKQHRQWTCIPLCYECHQGTNGWHGNKSIWRIKKLDELDALNITIQRLMEEVPPSVEW